MSGENNVAVIGDDEMEQAALGEFSTPAEQELIYEDGELNITEAKLMFMAKALAQQAALIKLDPRTILNDAITALENE